MVFLFLMAKMLHILGFLWHDSVRNVTKKKFVWCEDPDLRSKQRKKNNVFLSNSTKNTPDLKISPGNGQSRASYLENLLSELRSDQTRRSYSRETQKRVLDFRYCSTHILNCLCCVCLFVRLYKLDDLSPVFSNDRTFVLSECW